MPRHPKPLAERFWAKVDKSGECWVWTAYRNRNDYGMVGAGQRGNSMKLAHRASWELAFGPIPRGVNVLHRCDNPPCVNPSHLFLGTQADNIHDMLGKGRHRANPPRGERSPWSKLTGEKVTEIRRRAASGEELSTLGREFSVSTPTIWRIVHRMSWTHVP